MAYQEHKKEKKSPVSTVKHCTDLLLSVLALVLDLNPQVCHKEFKVL